MAASKAKQQVTRQNVGEVYQFRMEILETFIEMQKPPKFQGFLWYDWGEPNFGIIQKESLLLGLKWFKQLHQTTNNFKITKVIPLRMR